MRSSIFFARVSTGSPHLGGHFGTRRQGEPQKELECSLSFLGVSLLCPLRRWLDGGGNVTRNKSPMTLSPSWCGHHGRHDTHQGVCGVVTLRIIGSRSGGLSPNASTCQGSGGGKSEFKFDLVSGFPVSPFCIPNLLLRNTATMHRLDKLACKGVSPATVCSVILCSHPLGWAAHVAFQNL